MYFKLNHALKHTLLLQPVLDGLLECSVQNRLGVPVPLSVAAHQLSMTTVVRLYMLTVSHKIFRDFLHIYFFKCSHIINNVFLNLPFFDEGVFCLCVACVVALMNLFLKLTVIVKVFNETW